MDIKDTWLLLLGGIVGYIGSLIATFTAPSVTSVFGKLRSGFIERNKARALDAYVEARDLKSGKRDKYLYAIMSWGFILVHMLFFVTGSIIGLLDKDTVLRLPSLAIAMFATLMALRRTAYLVLTLDRVANFENYRAELLRRWPDIILPS
jgi:hypothetical protein